MFLVLQKDHYYQCCKISISYGHTITFAESSLNLTCTQAIILFSWTYLYLRHPKYPIHWSQDIPMGCGGNWLNSVSQVLLKSDLKTFGFGQPHNGRMHQNSTQYDPLYISDRKNLALLGITWHYLSLPSVTWCFLSLLSVTLHYFALHYFALHCIALLGINLHHSALPYIALH